MLIYADICTLCRPFDDQSQPRSLRPANTMSAIIETEQELTEEAFSILSKKPGRRFT